MLRWNDLPAELQLLMRDVVQDIHMARAHLEDRNYGSADMRLNAALDKLPMDNGVTIDWWELEKRTGA